MFSDVLNRFRDKENCLISYESKSKWQIKESKIKNLMEEVANIQRSVGWGDGYLSLASERCHDCSNLKVTVLDINTRERVAYAIVVPQNGVWYVSQFAVMKTHHNMGIGKCLAGRIFREARMHAINTVYLETDHNTVAYYRKLETNDRICKVAKVGIDSLNREWYRITYSLKHWVDSLIQEMDTQNSVDDKFFNKIDPICGYLPQSAKEIRQEDFKLLYERLKHRPSCGLFLKEIFAWISQKGNNEITKVLIDFISNEPSQQIKVDFAMACSLSDWGSSLIRFLPVFGIESEQDRFEIIKNMITNCRISFMVLYLDSFQKFGITNLEYIIELAKLSAEWNSEECVRFSQMLGIADENVVLTILDPYALKDLGFNILNKTEEELIPLFENAATNKGHDVANYIPFAKINDQDALIRIARNALRQSAFWVSRSFDRFKIEDEQVRIELYKEAFIYCDIFWIKRFCQSIKYFEIHDEKARISLAKWFLGQGVDISEWIKDFHISQEQDRVDIATLAAAVPSSNFSEFVEAYEIEQEEERKKLAVIALTNSPANFCQNFKNFRIMNESDRFMFANLVLDSSSNDVFLKIKDYEIFDEAQRIILAKKAFGKGLTGQMNTIREFKISVPEARYECAKLDASHFPTNMVSNWHKYNITNEKWRIEIAKIIARRDGGSLSQFIPQFCITDQSALGEIALLAAANNGLYTSFYIKNFNLQSEQMRILVALAAGSGACQYIANYEITDMDSLSKIAKNAAGFLGSEIIACMRYFKLDATSTYEVWKIYTRYNGEISLSYLNHFDLYFKNPEKFFEIAMIGILNAPISSDYCSYNLVQSKNPILKLFPAINREDQFPKAVEEVKQLVHNFFGTHDILNYFESELLTPPDAHFLTVTVGMLTMKRVSKENTQWIVEKGFIKSILKFQEVNMRYHLIDLITDIASTEISRHLFEKLYSGAPQHTLFPIMLAVLLIHQKVDDALVEMIINHAKKREYKDPKNLKALINGLYGILINYNFSINECSRLLKHVFASNDPSLCIMNIRMIEAIIGFGGKIQLQEEFLDLESIIIDHFKTKIPIK